MGANKTKASKGAIILAVLLLSGCETFKTIGKTSIKSFLSDTSSYQQKTIDSLSIIAQIEIKQGERPKFKIKLSGPLFKSDESWLEDKERPFHELPPRGSAWYAGGSPFFPLGSEPCQP